MAMLAICFKENGELHSVGHIDDKRLHLFANAMVPFLMCVSSDKSKDLIKRLRDFDSDGCVDTPLFAVEFRKQNMLDLYVAINDGMQNITRRTSFDARTIMHDTSSLSVSDQIKTVTQTHDFELLRVGNTLLRALTKVMANHKGTFVITEQG